MNLQVLAMAFLAATAIGGLAWVFLYDMIGEDANGKIIGRHRSTGIGRPRFWERARYFGEEKRLGAALDAAEAKDDLGANR